MAVFLFQDDATPVATFLRLANLWNRGVVARDETLFETTSVGDVCLIYFQILKVIHFNDFWTLGVRVMRCRLLGTKCINFIASCCYVNGEKSDF